MTRFKKFINTYFNSHAIEYVLRMYRGISSPRGSSLQKKAAYCRVKQEILCYWELVLNSHLKRICHKPQNVIANAGVNGDLMVVAALKKEMIAYSLKYFNNEKNAVIGLDTIPHNNYGNLSKDQLVNLYQDSIYKEELIKMLNVIDKYCEKYNYN